MQYAYVTFRSMDWCQVRRYASTAKQIEKHPSSVGYGSVAACDLSATPKSSMGAPAAGIESTQEVGYAPDWASRSRSTRTSPAWSDDRPRSNHPRRAPRGALLAFGTVPSMTAPLVAIKDLTRHFGDPGLEADRDPGDLGGQTGHVEA